MAGLLEKDVNWADIDAEEFEEQQPTAMAFQSPSKQPQESSVQVSDSLQIFIQGVPHNTTQAEIMKFFGHLEITSVQPYNDGTNFVGYYVTFKHGSMTSKAQEMDNQVWPGTNLRIQIDTISEGQEDTQNANNKVIGNRYHGNKGNFLNSQRSGGRNFKNRDNFNHQRQGSRQFEAQGGTSGGTGRGSNQKFGTFNQNRQDSQGFNKAKQFSIQANPDAENWRNPSGALSINLDRGPSKPLSITEDKPGRLASTDLDKRPSEQASKTKSDPFGGAKPNDPQKKWSEIEEREKRQVSGTLNPSQSQQLASQNSQTQQSQPPIPQQRVPQQFQPAQQGQQYQNRQNRNDFMGDMNNLFPSLEGESQGQLLMQTPEPALENGGQDILKKITGVNQAASVRANTQGYDHNDQDLSYSASAQKQMQDAQRKLFVSEPHPTEKYTNQQQYIDSNKPVTVLKKGQTLEQKKQVPGYNPNDQDQKGPFQGKQFGQFQTQPNNSSQELDSSQKQVSGSSTGPGQRKRQSSGKNSRNQVPQGQSPNQHVEGQQQAQFQPYNQQQPQAQQLPQGQFQYPGPNFNFQAPQNFMQFPIQQIYHPQFAQNPMYQQQQQNYYSLLLELANGDDEKYKQIMSQPAPVQIQMILDYGFKQPKFLQSLMQQSFGPNMPTVSYPNQQTNLSNDKDQQIVQSPPPQIQTQVTPKAEHQQQVQQQQQQQATPQHTLSPQKLPLQSPKEGSQVPFKVEQNQQLQPAQQSQERYYPGTQDRGQRRGGRGREQRGGREPRGGRGGRGRGRGGSYSPQEAYKQQNNYNNYDDRRYTPSGRGRVSSNRYNNYSQDYNDDYKSGQQQQQEENIQKTSQALPNAGKQEVPVSNEEIQTPESSVYGRIKPFSGQETMLTSAGSTGLQKSNSKNFSSSGQKSGYGRGLGRGTARQGRGRGGYDERGHQQARDHQQEGSIQQEQQQPSNEITQSPAKREQEGAHGGQERVYENKSISNKKTYSPTKIDMRQSYQGPFNRQAYYKDYGYQDPYYMSQSFRSNSQNSYKNNGYKMGQMQQGGYYGGRNDRQISSRQQSINNDDEAHLYSPSSKPRQPSQQYHTSSYQGQPSQRNRYREYNKNSRSYSRNVSQGKEQNLEPDSPKSLDANSSNHQNQSPNISKKPALKQSPQKVITQHLKGNDKIDRKSEQAQDKKEDNKGRSSQQGNEPSKQYKDFAQKNVKQDVVSKNPFELLNQQGRE